MRNRSSEETCMVDNTPRVHVKTRRKCKHKGTKCNSFVCGKHAVTCIFLLVLPSFPLLMQNDTVQHLLKSHFVYIVISLSLSFHNLAELRLFILKPRWGVFFLPPPGDPIRVKHVMNAR